MVFPSHDDHDDCGSNGAGPSSSVSEDPCGKLISYFSLIDALVLCFKNTTSANGSYITTGPL